MVSIIVVTHNTLSETRHMLDILLARTKPEHEIIVVDNASRDGTPAWLLGADNRLHVILNGENVGFAPAVNQGAAASRGEVIVMLNADVLVPPDWADRLCAHLREGVGAVGPLATACGPQQNLLGIDVTKESAFLAADRYLRRRFGGQGKVVGFLAGFCLALRREVFDRVSGLDPTLRLGADDFDLCLRLQRLGLRLVVALDVFVRHSGHAAFREAGEPAELMNRESLERFREKWGAGIEAFDRIFFGKGAEPVRWPPG